MNVVSASMVPADAYPESRGAAASSAAANAGTWIDWNADGSTAEAGVGPADPAIPGSAPRARAAVSAAPATILEGRTISARYSIDGRTGSADDQHLVGDRFDGAGALIGPGEDEDPAARAGSVGGGLGPDELRSEEHTSELQSHHDLPPFPTRRSSDLGERRARDHPGGSHDLGTILDRWADRISG